jgi:tRNA(His) 5'-end guanylyltransferase
VDSRAFAREQRAREWFHRLTVPPGVWSIVRLDGRGFSRLTMDRYTKPFDAGFARVMADTARDMLGEFGARYAHTHSDEISLLFDPDCDLFGRSLEKIVSVTAGAASATFTELAGHRAHFDSRVWIGAGLPDVIGYYSWRQSDAARNALSSLCYWTLRTEGASAAAATKTLSGASASSLNELLLARGVNFDAVPAWQRSGIGLWREPDGTRTGYDPIARTEVKAPSRAVRIEWDLPVKDEYRALVAQIAGAAATADDVARAE